MKNLFAIDSRFKESLKFFSNGLVLRKFHIAQLDIKQVKHKTFAYTLQISLEKIIHFSTCIIQIRPIAYKLFRFFMFNGYDNAYKYNFSVIN